MLLSANNLKNTDAGKPNHVYELNPAAAKFWFGVEDGSTRLARMGVHGDGSCAYHSICTALNIEDYVHQSDEMQKQIAYRFRCSFSEKLTQDALKAILKKQKPSKSPVRLSEVQDNLCDPKVWADETTIRFMAETLDMNIIFLDMSKNAVYCGVHHDKAVESDGVPPTIVVCWVNHSHFEPLGQIVNVGPRVTEMRVVFDPAKYPQDGKLLETLMDKYKHQCAIRR